MTYGIIYIRHNGNIEPFPVTNMYNADGEETDQIEDVVTVVVKVSDDVWLTGTAEPNDIQRLM